MKNEIEILKREKQGLEKFILEKENMAQNVSRKNVLVEKDLFNDKSKRINQSLISKSNYNSMSNKNNEQSMLMK